MSTGRVTDPAPSESAAASSSSHSISAPASHHPAPLPAEQNISNDEVPVTCLRGGLMSIHDLRKMLLTELQTITWAAGLGGIFYRVCTWIAAG